MYIPGVEQQNPPDNGKRDVHQDQQGVRGRIECEEEQGEYDGDGHGNDEIEPSPRPIEVLKLAPPVDLIARGE